MALFIVGSHLFFASVGKIFLRGSARRAYLAALLHKTSRVFLGAFNIKVTVEGERNWKPQQTYLVASNHLSYLDPLVISCFRTASFISSVEMQETPGLGLILDLSGTYFVERRTSKNLRKEMSSIERFLREGFTMVLFPESTSTDGARVYDFKRVFFVPPKRARVPVLPIVIQPTEINGKKFDLSNRDFYCWYGSMGFLSHFFRLAGLQSMKITLKILPEVLASHEERDNLVELAFTQISRNYEPLTPPR